LPQKELGENPEIIEIILNRKESIGQKTSQGGLPLPKI